MTNSADSADSAATHAAPAQSTAERNPVPNHRREASPFDGLPVLIAVPRAAKILGISRASAYRLAAADELPVRHLGGRVYVVTQQLRQLIEGTTDERAA
jgi:predicted DNA-binding transcriptional regulator AlpA